MSRRTISWSAALQDPRADRADRHEIREERLRATAGLKGTPAVALSAWRGLSGRRYVVGIHDLTLDALDDAGTDAVVIVVRRDDAGIAGIVDVGAGLTRGERIDLLTRATKAGAGELHIHRLAKGADERAAIVADLAPRSLSEAA